MKKFLSYILISVFTLLNFNFVFANVSKSEIMVEKNNDSLFNIWPEDNVDLSLWVDASDADIKDNFIKTIQRYILWIVALVAVSVFLYIWFELFTAEWNPDKFKKALKALVYAAVWLAVIPLAYVVVKIATWFSF